MRPLVIYHFAWADGIAAAWAAWSALGRDCDLWSASYNKPPPPDDRLAGRDVAIVDFSYPLGVLREMAQKARSVLVGKSHTARILASLDK